METSSLAAACEDLIRIMANLPMQADLAEWKRRLQPAQAKGKKPWMLNQRKCLRSNWASAVVGQNFQQAA